MTEGHAVAINSDCECLADGAGRVFKSYVFGGEIIRIDDSRWRAKGADWFAVFANHIRVQVISENRFFNIFANQTNKTLFVLNVNKLFVNARFDENDCRVISTRCLRHCIDCFLHCLELTAAVGRNEQSCLS